MKRILIDFLYYQSATQFHGGGEYGNTVIKALLKERCDCEFGIFCYKSNNKNSQLLNDCKNMGWRIHEIVDVSELGEIVKKHDYDTLYSALPYEINWRETNINRNIHFICTVHGLRMIENAHYEESEKLFWKDGKVNGDHDYLYNAQEIISMNYPLYCSVFDTFYNTDIVTVSEYSKYAIYRYFPEFDKNKIHVLFSPLKIESGQNIQRVEKEYDMLKVVKENYALIVSAGIWYKNALRSVKAYDYVFEHYSDSIPSDYTVVLTGVKDEQRLLSKIKNKDKFIILNYVESDLLEYLLQNAHILFYPSLNEGFGYPPLEAMKYGTICLCSANTSIIEVCGEMAIYFNPLLIDDMIIKILQGFSTSIREKKSTLIKERLKYLFSKQETDLKLLIDLITN